MGHWYRITTGLLVVISMLQGCSKPSGLFADSIDAYVGSESGDNHYTSIQAAIDAAPGSADWTIFVMPGVYNERVVVNKPGIRLIGSGKHNTLLRFARYAGEPIAIDSDETWGTYRTAVMEIVEPDVSIFDLTIQNSFDYPANDRLPTGHPDRINGTQAVALRMSANADRTVLQRVRLLGYQDTLYAQSGRTYVTDSEILGHIDFIFGAGNVVFEYADIISRPRTNATPHSGYVSAPSTLSTEEFGLTFVNCRLLREIGVPDNSVPLGRPWHPTTTFEDGRYANPNAIGKSTFINTFMDAHIAEAGWTTMEGRGKDGTRIRFSPLDDARFSEYGSYGPGAKINQFRPQLAQQALPSYSVQRILAGWKPALLSRSEHHTLLQDLQRAL